MTFLQCNSNGVLPQFDNLAVEAGILDQFASLPNTPGIASLLQRTDQVHNQDFSEINMLLLHGFMYLFLRIIAFYKYSFLFVALGLAGA